MENRVTKYKDYRTAIIKEDTLADSIDIDTEGKHSSLGTNTLPYNDVIQALDADNDIKKKKNYIKINIIISIVIAIIVIIGIIIFAIFAFGGK